MLNRRLIILECTVLFTYIVRTVQYMFECTRVLRYNYENMLMYENEDILCTRITVLFITCSCRAGYTVYENIGNVQAGP